MEFVVQSDSNTLCMQCVMLIYFRSIWTRIPQK